MGGTPRSRGQPHVKRGRKKNPENIADGQQAKAIAASFVAPEYLDPLGRVIFARLVKTLEAMNILTAGDLDVVASYAEIASLGQKHKALIDSHGATFTSSKTGFQGMNADYLIWRDCAKSAQKLLNDLGLTPASRTRVAAALTHEADEFATFMAMRNGKSVKETKGQKGRSEVGQD
jgi:P27 family predicted phage terminase small subunit